MAKRKPKQVVTLDNGKEIETTSEGWSDEYIDNQHVLVAGWGSNPHFGLNQSYLVAIEKKLSNHIIGKYKGKNVLSATTINEDILNIYIEAKALDVQKIRIATSLSPGMVALKEALMSSPEMQELFKLQKPEAYAKMFPPAEMEEDATDTESDVETTDLEGESIEPVEELESESSNETEDDVETIDLEDEETKEEVA